MNDVTPAEYHGDGPMYDGESIHQALGENTAYSLGGHLVNKAAQRFGRGLEHEPVDDAERASQQTARNAARSAPMGLQDGRGDGTPAYDFHANLSQIRSALRTGA